MALLKRTVSNEIAVWSGRPTPEDRITVTLASGAKIVFTGIAEYGPGMVAPPAFKLDKQATSPVSLSVLYEDVTRLLYHQKSVWWRLRHPKLKNKNWIEENLDFAIQPDDYPREVSQINDVVIGSALYVHLLTGNKVVRNPEIQPFFCIRGSRDRTVHVTKDRPEGDSTIVSVE